MIDEHDKDLPSMYQKSQRRRRSGLLKIGSDPNKQILSNYILSSNCNTIGNANINISNNYYSKKVPKKFYGTLKSRNGKWVCRYFYHTVDVMRFIIFNKEIISNISIIESKITESRKEYRVFFYIENENKLII